MLKFAAGFLTGIITLFVLMLVFGNYDPESSTPVVATNSLPTAAVPRQSPPSDTAEADNYSLEALDVENPAAYPSTEADSGYRIIAVEMIVGNVSGEPFSSNPLFASLIDDDGFVYQADLSAIENRMELSDVLPGQRVRGWIGFVVPDNSIPSVVRFRFDRDNIIEASIAHH